MCKWYLYKDVNRFQDGYCELLKEKVSCLARESECEVNWGSYQKNKIIQIEENKKGRDGK